MSNFHTEKVISVRHWTDRLFSFRTTRNPALRFRSGQFVMMGLATEGKPLLRAYSLASAPYEDGLEFFSIKVPDGPLTSRLQHLNEGDEVLVGRKPTGTLLIDNLRHGRNLFLLGTGTGLAPYLSLVKDPETYERFERVILVHGVRFVKDLAYSDYLSRDLPNDELIGELAAAQLSYYPTVTREPALHNGRISTLLDSGKLHADLGLPGFDAAADRFMLCGSEAMIADLKTIFLARELQEGNTGEPGDFVIEKAFVEK
ncbi:MAG: ferredoxin--NADP reductase [Hyphomicrobiales bacterium]|nr:ferredoxin--NADP reductase [Hyphomicrobiales bacterium]